LKSICDSVGSLERRYRCARFSNRCGLPIAAKVNGGNVRPKTGDASQITVFLETIRQLLDGLLNTAKQGLNALKRSTGSSAQRIWRRRVESHHPKMGCNPPPPTWLRRLLIAQNQFCYLEDFNFFKCFVLVFFINEFHCTCDRVNYINIYPVTFQTCGYLYRQPEVLSGPAPMNKNKPSVIIAATEPNTQFAVSFSDRILLFGFMVI